MKTLFAATAAAVLMLSAAPAAFAAPAAPVAAGAAGLSAASTMADLMANPAARAVLEKHIPMVVEFFASGQAESILPPSTTLADLADIAEAGISADMLAAMNAELSAL